MLLRTAPVPVNAVKSKCALWDDEGRVCCAQCPSSTICHASDVYRSMWKCHKYLVARRMRCQCLVIKTNHSLCRKITSDRFLCRFEWWNHLFVNMHFFIPFLQLFLFFFFILLAVSIQVFLIAHHLLMHHFF